jgi:hypothetical protein
LRYVVRDKSWTLHSRDRNGRWHRYADADPTADVTVLLSEVDEDPTGIFWADGRSTDGSARCRPGALVAVSGIAGPKSLSARPAQKENPAISGALVQAAEGTRTLDLLHGKQTL